MPNHATPATPAALGRGRRAPGPRDLRRHRPHPDPGARRRDEPALARRRLLAPLAGLRRAARTRRRKHRPPGGRPGPRFARGQRDRGQRRGQAARPAAPPGPSGRRGPARAPRADAELALVSLRPLRRRLRVRDRRRPRVAGGRSTAARTRRAGRIFARPHRRPLPRRRAGRRPDRHRTGTAHDIRGRPPPARPHGLRPVRPCELPFPVAGPTAAVSAGAVRTPAACFWSLRRLPSRWAASARRRSRGRGR